MTSSSPSDLAARGRRSCGFISGQLCKALSRIMTEKIGIIFQTLSSKPKELLNKLKYLFSKGNIQDCISPPSLKLLFDIQKHLNRELQHRNSEFVFYLLKIVVYLLSDLDDNPSEAVLKKSSEMISCTTQAYLQIVNTMHICDILSKLVNFKVLGTWTDTIEQVALLVISLLGYQGSISDGCVPHLLALSDCSQLTIFQKSKLFSAINDLLGNGVPTGKKEQMGNKYSKRWLQSIAQTGDFEVQLLMLEAIFRLSDRRMRSKFVAESFSEAKLQETLLAIDPKEIDIGGRMFLNCLNKAQGLKKCVASFPCSTYTLGDRHLDRPKDSDQFWIDFNYHSNSISAYVEDMESPNEEEDSDLGGWVEVKLYKSDVLSHKLCIVQNSAVLEVKLNKPALKLVKGWEGNSKNSSLKISFDRNLYDGLLRSLEEVLGSSRPMTHTPLCLSTTTDPVVPRRKVSQADSFIMVSNKKFYAPVCMMHPRQTLETPSVASPARQKAVSTPESAQTTTVSSKADAVGSEFQHFSNTPATSVLHKTPRTSTPVRAPKLHETITEVILEESFSEAPIVPSDKQPQTHKRPVKPASLDAPKGKQLVSDRGKNTKEVKTSKNCVSSLDQKKNDQSSIIVKGKQQKKANHEKQPKAPSKPKARCLQDITNTAKPTANSTKPTRRSSRIQNQSYQRDKSVVDISMELDVIQDSMPEPKSKRPPQKACIQQSQAKMKGNAGCKNDSKKKQWNNLSSNLTTSHILTASKGLRQKDYSTESDPYAFNERDSPLMVTQPSKQKPPRKWYEQDVPGLKEKQPRVYTGKSRSYVANYSLDLSDTVENSGVTDIARNEKKKAPLNLKDVKKKKCITAPLDKSISQSPRHSSDESYLPDLKKQSARSQKGGSSKSRRRTPSMKQPAKEPSLSPILLKEACREKVWKTTPIETSVSRSTSQKRGKTLSRFTKSGASAQHSRVTPVHSPPISSIHSSPVREIDDVDVMMDSGPRCDPIGQEEGEGLTDPTDSGETSKVISLPYPQQSLAKSPLQSYHYSGKDGQSSKVTKLANNPYSETNTDIRNITLEFEAICKDVIAQAGVPNNLKTTQRAKTSRQGAKSTSGLVNATPNSAQSRKRTSNTTSVAKKPKVTKATVSKRESAKRTTTKRGIPQLLENEETALSSMENWKETAFGEQESLPSPMSGSQSLQEDELPVIYEEESSSQSGIGTQLDQVFQKFSGKLNNKRKSKESNNERIKQFIHNSAKVTESHWQFCTEKWDSVRNGLSAKVSPLVRNIEEDVGTMCEAFQNIQRVMSDVRNEHNVITYTLGNQSKRLDVLATEAQLADKEWIQSCRDIKANESDLNTEVHHIAKKFMERTRKESILKVQNAVQNWLSFHL